MGNLSLRGRLLLDIIGEHDGEPLRVSDLIRIAQAGTPPTVYAGVAELEREGWIARSGDPADARASRLKLSPKAKRAFTRMSREVARLAVE